MENRLILHRFPCSFLTPPRSKHLKLALVQQSSYVLCDLSSVNREKKSYEVSEKTENRDSFAELSPRFVLLERKKLLPVNVQFIPHLLL